MGHCAFPVLLLPDVFQEDFLQGALPLWRYSVIVLLMDTQKRATVYFESDVHRALRLKAAAETMPYRLSH
jgi:hypothetical protein